MINFTMIVGNLSRLLPKREFIILRNKISNITSDKHELPASFVDYSEFKTVDPKNFNKSGLLPQHRNLVKNELPYVHSNSWIHLTEKYQRKQYGRYGSKSNVKPQICFNNKQSNVLAVQKESLLESDIFLQMMKNIQINKSSRRDAVITRENEISKKIEKLHQWKAELNAKVAKKEYDAQAAKDRKERIIEEVRRHFGFKVDARDERFKEMLELKEKEDKRKQKEVKRKAKEEKMMAKLVEKTSSP